MTNDEDAQRPQVLGIVYRAISTFLIRRAGLRVGAGARTEAVTLIQRFGSLPTPICISSTEKCPRSDRQRT